LRGRLGEAAVGQHFVAVSTDAERTARFGIDPAQVFGFWDWVGGRYSLWSSVGLPIALCCGPEVFANLLAGAREMDVHFRTAPPDANLPLRLALIALWNTNFLSAASQVVAAYADRMEHFVPWLQQLEMESNGKGVDREGHAVDYRTTPPLWGGVGTNAQHAFFQMLHQGPQPQPIDFVLVASGNDDPVRQEMLLANGIAQASALAFGKDETAVRAELAAGGLGGAALEAAVPHRVFPGDRPSNLLLLPRLDARHLGALLALYEHRSFMLGVLWNVNSFDQWGVELGKQLAGEVLAALEGGEVSGLDAAAAATVRDLCR
jgi:glucose-6-phosphate isomerase (EC 5.3.1.9)